MDSDGIAPFARARYGGNVRPYDTRRMRQDVWIPLLVILIWATVARGLLVLAQKLPPTCARCGRRFERRHLGEAVCSCHR